MYALVRSFLIFALAAAVVVLVAVHGFIRGLVVVMALAFVTTVPRTRAWRIGERWLVRVTGSRRRAALVVLLVLIGALALVNFYNITH